MINAGHHCYVDHATGGLTLNDDDMRTEKPDAKFLTTHHTGIMIPVFAFGPGASVFGGIYENNAIFDKMFDAFGFKRTP